MQALFEKCLEGAGIEPRTSWSIAESANHWTTNTAQKDEGFFRYIPKPRISIAELPPLDAVGFFPYSYDVA